MKSSRTVWCMAVALGVVVSSSVWAGKFVPVYSEVSDPVFREWQQELKADRVLESLAEYLNGTLILPMDVTITVAGCQTSNATAFFFYHELGHALIHVLDLPTTGREEDAVDQLSTYILAHESEDGDVPTLDAALAFLAWSEEAQESEAKPAFWGEHSLNEQRFFNLVCWVYGQDPGWFQNLVQEGHPPPPPEAWVNSTPATAPASGQAHWH